MKEGTAQVDNVILMWALIMSLGFSPTKASLEKAGPLPCVIMLFPSVWIGDLGITGSRKSNGCVIFLPSWISYDSHGPW